MNQRKENMVQIVSRMKDFGLGLQRKTVGTAPFGSTSIPDMEAKPILDVMLTFKIELELNKAIPMLEELGFIYKGDAVGQLQQTELDPNRYFFAFYDLEQKVDYIHLHMFTKNHPDSTHKIEFRNALRKNAALAQEYTKLKQRLKNDNLKRHEYTLSKGDFIAGVLMAHK